LVDAAYFVVNAGDEVEVVVQGYGVQVGGGAVFFRQAVDPHAMFEIGALEVGRARHDVDPMAARRQTANEASVGGSVAVSPR